MKIAIIGAGAIGGYVGTRLALAGEDVTFLVRGANLAAIRARGITLQRSDGPDLVAANVTATDDYRAAGPQDVVIVALKAQQLDDVAEKVSMLLGEHTVVVTMQNGIPFWYFHRCGNAHEGTVVRSVDPTGTLADRIPPERVLGCVVYPASELVAPGVIRHVEGDRFPLGELDGSASERVARVAASFVGAGFKAPVLDDIRGEIWLKLWGNLCFNPISALTRSTLADICQDGLTRDVAASMMREAEQVANKLGVRLRVPLEKRISGAERVGRHKTSMLQDVEGGRALEIDAILGSVVELARLTETPTPHLDTVYALTQHLGKTITGIFDAAAKEPPGVAATAGAAGAGVAAATPRAAVRSAPTATA